ncbi:MAG: AIR synthase-related protein, partial [Terrimicrobiaceae bacterium]
LALVPKRETGMTPYETLLSESQERMLVIVKKGEEAKVKEIFEKWDLPYAQVGEVKDDGFMRVKENGVTVVEIPARALADEAPVYQRVAALRTPPEEIDFQIDCDIFDTLNALLAHPSIASKRWVWRQYDHMVRLGAAVLPGSDAAVFLVREADKILAATSDCNAVYCKQEPREGAKIAVAEAARNLACSGAVPIAVTDNLNFGNPHKPENFLQLREAVEGLAEACREFGTPVTGGNVSLYNESPAGSIDPTPTVGMVGLIADAKHITTQHFKTEGDVILLVGELGNEIGASHLLLLAGQKKGPPPRLDYAKEKAVQDATRALIRMGLVQSAHDCAEGGLAVNLAESCLSGPGHIGAEIDFGTTGLAPAILLYNESQSRIVISVKKQNATAVLALLEWRGVPARKLGVVSKNPELKIAADASEWNWSLADLEEFWGHRIEELMEG